MKRIVRSSLTSLALASGLTMVNSTRADTPITTFDSFAPNALYSSWSAGTATATPTNYIITATGYGSLWKQLGAPPINGAGNSNIVVDVTLSGSAGADGNLGVIVDLKDADNTQISYRWYGRSTGHHILVGNLFDAGVPATDNGVIITNNLYRIVTNAAGTTAGLDLTALWHLNLALDPYIYGGAYTLEWNDLRLTGGSNANSGSSTGVCAVVSAFDNTVLSGLYGGWTTQTPTATSLQVTATGWGGGWAAVTPNINTTSNKTLQLNVTLTAPAAANGKLGPIVVLEDGDGTQLRYAWYGQTPGTNLVLSSVLSGGTIVQAGSVADFDFSTIKFYNLQLDPGGYAGSYTLAWNDLSIIGCDSGGSGATGICAEVSTFDNVGLSGLYGNWTTQTPTPTNLQVTATGWGGGYAGIVPSISTTSNKTLQLNVTLAATAAANGKLGPIVVLEDGDGTQIRFAWYGQTPANNLVLTNALSAGTIVQGGTLAGFDFSSIKYFQLQLDPGGYAGSYTAAWNDLAIIGCDNTNSETGFCATVCSFKNFFMSGDYGNWSSANEISTPDYWEMSASGFGGGYSSLYPNLTTTSNRTLQLNVTLIAPAAANGKLGPIVVLQDADGTQLTYAWYGQSPGTNLVLTKALNAGAPVGGQPGTTAGFDFGSIAFFHLQLDSGSYADAYTIRANDLSIIGCPPVIIQITAFSYDPVSGQFNLTWSSENGATYAIQTSSDLGTTFADAYTGVASGGPSTSVSITPLDPARTFIRIRKE
jgi:uncharacterized ParB-like nuclease family protein